MGIFLSLLSCIFSSAKDLISKRVAHRLDGTTSTFASFAFALPYYAVLLTTLYALGYETLEYSLMFFWLVFLRSVTDTFAEWMKMYAFSYGDISVVSSFFSLSPLFLLLASPLLTGDEPSWLGAVAVLLVVLGSLVMVYRPRPHVYVSDIRETTWAGQKKGILLALGASIFFALNSCFDRLAVQRGTPVVAGFAMTLLSATFLLPLVLLRAERTEALRANWGDFALRGFLEVAFMVAKLTALQYLQAPYVVGLQRVSLLLSIIGGRVFFKEVDFGRRLAAGALILLGVLLIVLAEELKLSGQP